MKKLALIICVVFSSLISKSQSYDSLVVDDARWVVRYFWIPSPPLSWDIGYEYFISGDSVIGINNYKKLFAHQVLPDTINSSMFNEIQPPFLFGLIREDVPNKKIYLIQYGGTMLSGFCITGNEQLIYDFSLNIGDTMNNILICNVPPTVSFVLDTIITTMTNWGNRKVFQFDNTEIIEGIGSPYWGPFETIIGTNNGSYQGVLYSYCRGTAYNCGTLVTSNQELENNPVIKISPNPVTDILQISNPSNIKSISIYNSTSQLVKTISEDNFKNSNRVSVDVSQLKNGFYFVSIITATNIFNAKIVKQ